jgi:CxxC-x17-CxxC domain-containing protein
MKDFKKGGRGGFRQNSFGGRPSFTNNARGGRSTNRGFDQGATEMFSATCAQCGKRCEVPFRPTGERPVFCRDCFRSQEHVPGRNSNGEEHRGMHNSPVSRGGERTEREFRPHPTKTYSPDGLDSLKRQIIALESKVDRILQIVAKRSASPTLATPPEEEVAHPAPSPTTKPRKRTEKPAKKRATK